ncbi:MAG: protein kinase [Anaerolineales bacterium]
MALQPGATLRQRYRIEETLGQGGMGAVYRALDINLGVKVAVKENLFTTQDYARQFRREATILASLRHPNLPRVTDHFVIEGEGQYLVMDFVGGEDLRHRLERDGPISESEAIPLFLEIADALAYLHSRTPSILHRDIKPGNIKINVDDKAILVDFGLAKVVDDDAETSTGAKAMTPGFSPPEQYGSGSTDNRTDIYSLAATFYTALTAAIPEDSLERAMGRAKLTGIRSRNPDVSPALARVVERALALEPEQRYQTINEFANAIANAAGSSRPTLRSDLPYLQQTVVAGQRTLLASPRTQLAKDRTRRRWPAVGLVIVVVAAIAAGAVYALPEFGGRTGGILPTSSAPSGSPIAGGVGGNATPTDSGQSPTATVSVVENPTDIPTETETIPSGPTPTPQGGGVGQLALASARSGLPQIYLMNIDGTGLKQLTDLSDGACQPDWSPDGERIAFTSPCRTSREQYPGASIWVMSVDGSDMRPLATAPGGDYDPAWSPEGDKIAFTSLQRGWPQVFVMDLDGSGRTNLSDNSAHESGPSWSPSGTQLIFVSTRSGISEVWVMTADGGEAQRFSHSADRDDQEPSWSPDGGLVVFDQETSGIRHLVATQFGETSSPEVRICTDGPLSVQPMAEPRWSPDGRWLTFETWPSGVDHNVGLMTSNCTGYAELTTDEALDFDASWRP